MVPWLHSGLIASVICIEALAIGAFAVRDDRPCSRRRGRRLVALAFVLAPDPLRSESRLSLIAPLVFQRALNAMIAPVVPISWRP